jgi:lysozyme
MKTLWQMAILFFVVGVVTSHAQSAASCVRRYDNNQHTTQHQYEAMVDFTFNVGCGAFRKSTLLKKVNKGDMHGAAQEFFRWTMVKGKVVPSLMHRRRDEYNLFVKP